MSLALSPTFLFAPGLPLGFSCVHSSHISITCDRKTYNNHQKSHLPLGSNIPGLAAHHHRASQPKMQGVSHERAMHQSKLGKNSQLHVSQSPTVACLNSPYKISLSSLVVLSGSVLASSATLSKSACRRSSMGQHCIVNG